MNWYIAKLVFQIINANGKPQFDEQLRLIAALNYAEALDKAKDLGFAEQESFLDVAERPVQWQFVAVPELQPLEHLQHGTELYSRIEEKEQSETYVKWLKLKADSISVKTSSAFAGV